MKAAPIALLVLACTLPLAAAAQWQWLDKDGRKVFSDKAPPPDIAPERVLKAPKGHMPVIGTAAPAPGPVPRAPKGHRPVIGPAAPAAEGAAETPAGAALPKPLGRDPALEQ